MQEERKIFNTFLGLHAHRACTSDAPVAYLHFYDPEKNPSMATAELVKFTPADVTAELDATQELVRWLLHQLSTYDCARQRIVGVVFRKDCVLSEVLRAPRNTRDAAAR